VLAALAASVALADDKPKADAQPKTVDKPKAEAKSNAGEKPKATTSRCREYRSSAIRRRPSRS
jgi:hypothetical protein